MWPDGTNKQNIPNTYLVAKCLVKSTQKRDNAKDLVKSINRIPQTSWLQIDRDRIR